MNEQTGQVENMTPVPPSQAWQVQNMMPVLACLTWHRQKTKRKS